jgi:hypothetical protein
VNYKRVSTVALVPHICFLKSPYSFPHRGSLKGCEVFNEAELMYPEASIKLHPPKIRIKQGSKQLTRLAENSTNVSRKISEP